MSRICELFPKELKFMLTCISRGRPGARITVDSGLPPKICLLPKVHINSTIAGNWIGRHWKKDSRESRTKRRGVDVIEFRDGKIIQKLTCSNTTVEIDGAKTRLSPVESRK